MTSPRRLNVTKPTIYYYVTNKDEILTEIFRTGCGALAEAADEVDASDLKGLDKLAAFMRRYAELMTTDFVMNVALLEDTCLGPEMRAEVREIKSAIDRRFRTFVEEGIRDGAIAECDPKLAAFTIAGALNGIARWYQPGGPLDPPEIAETIVNHARRGPPGPMTMRENVLHVRGSRQLDGETKNIGSPE